MLAAHADDWYRRTLDSLIEGFQIVGFDWKYLYVNPAAAAQGRSTPAELKGRKMWEAYPGFENSTVFAHMQRCMSERSSAALENLFTFPDGSTQWFELRIEPVPEGLCVLSYDIQPRKAAQADLVRLNEDLEHRVAARTRELLELNAELDAFSHTVSHDLRAPLRHINGFASALFEDAGPRLNDEDRDHLNRISLATQRLGAMIDSLLAFSRLGRRQLQTDYVELAPIIAEARENLAPDADGRRVEWTIDAPHAVRADGALLQLAMVNLLSNALKYTRRCDPARIGVGSRVTDAGETVVSVRDNGVGFDMKHAPNLFGVFQRFHADKEFDGTGIGLANVRRIISRHGGRTWAEGAVGSGATFHFSLPTAGQPDR